MCSSDLKLKNNKKATPHFKEAVRIKPDNYMAHFNLGLVYLNLKKNKPAIKEFKEVTRINPKYAQAHLSLAVLYDKEHDGGNAIFHSTKAETLFKDKYETKKSDQAKKYSQALLKRYKK